MELRRLREERNLGPHTAASLLGRTESSLSKLENAQRGIRKPALEQILDKYRVTDVTYRDALFSLARDAKKQGWWQRYEGTPFSITCRSKRERAGSIAVSCIWFQACFRRSPTLGRSSRPV
jgi:hypothetical protein